MKYIQTHIYICICMYIYIYTYVSLYMIIYIYSVFDRHDDTLYCIYFAHVHYIHIHMGTVVSNMVPEVGFFLRGKTC